MDRSMQDLVAQLSGMATMRLVGGPCPSGEEGVDPSSVGRQDGKEWEDEREEGLKDADEETKPIPSPSASKVLDLPELVHIICSFLTVQELSSTSICLVNSRFREAVELRLYGDLDLESSPARLPAFIEACEETDLLGRVGHRIKHLRLSFVVSATIWPPNLHRLQRLLADQPHSTASIKSIRFAPVFHDATEVFLSTAAEVIALCPKLKRISFCDSALYGLSNLLYALERYHPSFATSRLPEITLELHLGAVFKSVSSILSKRPRFAALHLDTFDQPWWRGALPGIVRSLTSFDDSDDLQLLAPVITFGPSLVRMLGAEETTERRRQGWALIFALSRQVQKEGMGRWVFPAGVEDLLSGVLEAEMAQEDLFELARRWYYARI